MCAYQAARRYTHTTLRDEMCGVFFFDITGLPDASVNILHTRSGAIAHRGPDGSNCEQFQGHGDRKHMIAFHRLAVINPMGYTGMQPFRSGDAAMICDGEIYNYCVVAESHRIDVATLGCDVHVLFHALVTCTDTASVCAMLEGLDGEFALVFCDQGHVIAARDPMGVRPLFVARDVHGCVMGFCSEAKALIGAPGVALVAVFPPGHVMILAVGAEDTCCAFRTASAGPCRFGTNEQMVRRLVESAIVKRINHSDRSVGILCSGGLDMAIVTALVATEASMRDRVRVFTGRYDSGQSDDAFYAALVCCQSRLDLELVPFGAADVLAAIEPVIWACETCDPNTIRAAIPMYLLARHIKQKTDVKVILSGEGASELCCGSAHTRIASDLLCADRCFGAFGLEVRVPYLDLALVDFVGSLPNRVEDRLLRDAFRDTRMPIGKILSGARVIDRPEEKLSDVCGCRFSFVPDLLANLGGEACTRVAQREKAEREHYQTVFDKLFGQENRVMVMWAKHAKQGNQGLVPVKA